MQHHINRVHLGIKIPCPHCGKEFSKKSNLHNHLHQGKGRKGCHMLRARASSAPVQSKEKERASARTRKEKIKHAQSGEEGGQNIANVESEEQVDKSHEEDMKSHVNTVQPDRLKWLKDQREIGKVQGRRKRNRLEEIRSAEVKHATGGENLHLLADLAMEERVRMATPSPPRVIRPGPRPQSGDVQSRRTHQATTPPSPAMIPVIPVPGGHVIQANGVTGHVSQLTQASQVISQATPDNAGVFSNIMGKFWIKYSRTGT